MAKTSDIPSGNEADLQEQETPAEPDAVSSGTGIGIGTGIEGEGTGGSEADRLEQATEVPSDGDDAYPRGTSDDDFTI